MWLGTAGIGDRGALAHQGKTRAVTPTRPTGSGFFFTTSFFTVTRATKPSSRRTGHNTRAVSSGSPPRARLVRVDAVELAVRTMPLAVFENGIRKDLLQRASVLRAFRAKEGREEAHVDGGRAGAGEDFVHAQHDDLLHLAEIPRRPEPFGLLAARVGDVVARAVGPEETVRHPAQAASRGDPLVPAVSRER